MENQTLEKFGPLAPFISINSQKIGKTIWEGSKGDDTAPSDDRGTEKNAFRERFELTPFGPANNHEQTLFGFSYVRTAWRLNEDSPFHEQVGYWFWDAEARLVMHSFLIPRAMTVLAGGAGEPGQTTLTVAATLGSATFGICSNPFLDREFKTVRYEGTWTIQGGSFTYEEDTQIQMKGRKELFHHIDKNLLKKQ